MTVSHVSRSETNLPTGRENREISGCRQDASTVLQLSSTESDPKNQQVTVGTRGKQVEGILSALERGFELLSMSVQHYRLLLFFAYSLEELLCIGFYSLRECHHEYRIVPKKC